MHVIVFVANLAHALVVAALPLRRGGLALELDGGFVGRSDVFATVPLAIVGV